MSAGGFCTDCRARVESFDGLSCCPSCGATSIPCADANQVTVSVNWHELHILSVWAENWQRVHVPESKTIYAITKRLAAQHPGRHPLTLAGELGEIAKQYDVEVTDADLRRDIAEQTGEEVGLMQLPEQPDSEAA